MSRRADWFAINREMVDLLGDNAGDNAVIEGLLRRLRESTGPDPALPRVELDKWWEPVHRCLADERADRPDFMDREHLLDQCVLGGLPLLRGAGRRYQTACLVDDTTVPEVSAAMQAVDREWMRERFFRIPAGQFYEIDEGAFRHVWFCFRELLVPLFARAESGNCGVVCAVER